MAARTCSEPDWAEHCSELAVERLRQATGRDLWAELGGCPRSWRDAAEVYRRLGAASLREAVGTVLGPEIDPKLAMRGDIVMVDNALGVCRGEWVEFVDRMQPLRRASCAWHIGE